MLGDKFQSWCQRIQIALEDGGKDGREKDREHSSNLGGTEKEKH